MDRFNADKYKEEVRKLKNFFVNEAQEAIKRPGSKFICVLQDAEVVWFAHNRNIVTNLRVIDLDVLNKQIPDAPVNPPESK